MYQYGHQYQKIIHTTRSLLLGLPPLSTSTNILSPRRQHHHRAPAPPPLPHSHLLHPPHSAPALPFPSFPVPSLPLRLTLVGLGATRGVLWIEGIGVPILHLCPHEVGVNFPLRSELDVSACRSVILVTLTSLREANRRGDRRDVWCSLGWRSWWGGRFLVLRGGGARRTTPEVEP